MNKNTNKKMIQPNNGNRFLLKVQDLTNNRKKRTKIIANNNIYLSKMTQVTTTLFPDPNLERLLLE